jgi:hypothetical protein
VESGSFGAIGQKVGLGNIAGPALSAFYSLCIRRSKEEKDDKVQASHTSACD